MKCREVREYLPARVEQAEGPHAAAVDEHLTACAGCRAVLEEYREMGAALSALALKTVDPPAWLLGTLTETVTERADRLRALRERRRRLAKPRVAAMGGAILVAGLAGAVLLRGRRRRRRAVSTRLRGALVHA